MIDNSVITSTLDLLNEIFEILAETYSITRLLMKFQSQNVGMSIMYDCIHAINKLLIQAEHLCQRYMSFYQGNENKQSVSNQQFKPRTSVNETNCSSIVEA